MKLLSTAAAVSILFLGWANVHSAQAQYYGLTGPYNQPALSPYLGLTNRGASAGQNWATLVYPQLYQNQRIGQLQSQLNSTQQTLQATPELLLSTGHPTAFLNYRKYFLNTSATAGAATLGSGSSSGPFAPTRAGFGTGQGLGGGSSASNTPRAMSSQPSGNGRSNLPY
jgi:hypothetical protein